MPERENVFGSSNVFREGRLVCKGGVESPALQEIDFLSMIRLGAESGKLKGYILGSKSSFGCDTLAVRDERLKWSQTSRAVRMAGSGRR